MNTPVKKKKQIQFRYYEIPQGEPCLALLGEAWVRRYGDGVDCLHFHNYMEIGLCYDGRGKMELFDESVNLTDGGPANASITMSHYICNMSFKYVSNFGYAAAMMVPFVATMRSTYAAAMTITFMNAWNSYLWPKVIMMDTASQTLPTAIVFFCLQNAFAEGITGAVK